MTDFSQFRLGEDNETVHIDSLAQLQAAALALAGQAQRFLDIFTLHLDKQVFGQPAFVDAVKQLAISNRHTRIRILVRDSNPVAREGHRLFHLGQDLTSKIHFHKPDDTHLARREAFMLADACGLLYQPEADRRDARACFNSPLEVSELRKFFDEVWRLSGPDPYLRRLTI